jgi:hypothetical protein
MGIRFDQKRVLRGSLYSMASESPSNIYIDVNDIKATKNDSTSNHLEGQLLDLFALLFARAKSLNSRQVRLQVFTSLPIAIVQKRGHGAYLHIINASNASDS